MDNNTYKQLSERSSKARSDIAENSLLKIWSYFNSLKNIDKTNLLKNIQSGQVVYYAPVQEIKGSRLINFPTKGEIYIDEKFMQEEPEIATFQITHECLHGVSLIKDGKQIIFGHSSRGGSDTNRYNGVLEASTQMFAEDAEGRRLPESIDYLYYVKNIMRAMKVLFGEETLANQFLGNNTDFEKAVDSFSQYKFDDFNSSMSDIYLLERKKQRIGLSEEEIQTLENYKLGLNKSVAELISLKSKDNPQIFDMIANEIQDEKFSKQLNPNFILRQKDEILYDFAKKFGSSYRYLESDSDYEERINSEQSDIEYIAEYVNRYNMGKLNDLDIRSKIVDKETGKMETRRIFQLLNAAKILSIGNQNYFETLCKSPEVKEILERMMKSPHIQNVIEDGEQTKKNNPNSKKPLTDGEKMNIDAKKALKTKKEELKVSDLDDEEIIFSDIITRVQKGVTTLGGFGKEDLALARICCFQREIKTVQRDFGGNYGLEVIEYSIDPQKIKRDTIKARISNLDINQMTRRIADKIRGINPKEKDDSDKIVK